MDDGTARTERLRELMGQRVTVTHPDNDPGLLEPGEIGRTRLEGLRISARRNHDIDCGEITGHCSREVCKIRGRCEHAHALCLHRQAGEKQDASSGERSESFNSLSDHRRATKMLLGIKQCTFFSVSEIAPTRQSMATLASP